MASREDAPNGAEWSPPSGRYPSYAEETLEQMESEGRIDFSGSEPRAKRYMAEVQEGQPPDAVLSPELVGFNADGTRELREIFGEGGVFSQPKPSKLVKFLLEIIRSKDALVLDSFAGSGTTAHAALALNKEDGGNRRFILVECEEYADAITAERVRRVIRGVPGARDAALRDGLGGSFTYMELGEAIGLEEMIRGEALPSYESLAAYLLYAATGASAGSGPLAPPDDLGLFHQTEKVNYHLLWKPDEEWLRSVDAVLNSERAERVGAACRAEGRKAVVFAPAKYIGQRDLSDLGITFCQLPYDLHREG